MSAKIIELSKYRKVVPVYEDETQAEPAVCLDGKPVRPFTAWMSPKKEYDLDEEHQIAKIENVFRQIQDNRRASELLRDDCDVLVYELGELLEEV